MDTAWEAAWAVGHAIGEQEHDFMIMREDRHIDLSFAS
jgi:hypothetical protein